MPRQARLDSPGTLHHVMIRGIEGREVLRDDYDWQDFLDRVSKLREETGTRIVAWDAKGGTFVLNVRSFWPIHFPLKSQTPIFVVSRKASY